MLCVPHGQDQPDNARRCVRLGVGRSITPSEYKVTRVVRELTAILADPHCAENAASVGKQVANEHGTERACNLIEEELAR